MHYPVLFTRLKLRIFSRRHIFKAADIRKFTSEYRLIKLKSFFTVTIKCKINVYRCHGSMIVDRNKCSVKCKVNGRPQVKRVNKIMYSYSSDIAAMGPSGFYCKLFLC